MIIIHNLIKKIIIEVTIYHFVYLGYFEKLVFLMP